MKSFFLKIFQGGFPQIKNSMGTINLDLHRAIRRSGFALNEEPHRWVKIAALHAITIGNVCLFSDSEASLR